MKNYAYMIFFDHFITPSITSIHTETMTFRSVTHPQSAPGLARLTSKFHLHELSLNPLYLIDTITLISLMCMWVCECVSVWVWVCECVSVSMCVCECKSVCMCMCPWVCVRKNPKNLKKFKNLKKNQKN
jgi:hypothetical protein